MRNVKSRLKSGLIFIRLETTRAKKGHQSILNSIQGECWAHTYMITMQKFFTFPITIFQNFLY